MNIDVVYLRVIGKCHPSLPDPSYYAQFTERYHSTYKRHRPLIPHMLHTVWCGNGMKPAFSADWWHDYTGGGKDIGAYQHVAKELKGDLAVFMATVSYLWKDGWLERLAAAFEKHGHGLYGPMASYENTPHIRTSCFACPPALLLAYPHLIDTVEKCVMFESCEGGFTDWVTKQGLPCKMVTWDNEYDRPEWRTPPNIFRRGDQSNCMTRDRYTDQYETATPREKRELEERADGNL